MLISSGSGSIQRMRLRTSSRWESIERKLWMSNVFGKLNFKAQNQILVLNAPKSFEPILAGLKGVTISRELGEIDEIEFSLAFVTTQRDLDRIAKAVTKKAKGDAIIWFAYPKKTSKKYQCEFNRDSGWDELGKAGYEGVRMVAIDEDWSALRFRNVQYIKSMKRDEKRAMTKEGKARVPKK